MLYSILFLREQKKSNPLNGEKPIIHYSFKVRNTNNFDKPSKTLIFIGIFDEYMEVLNEEWFNSEDI